MAGEYERGVVDVRCWCCRVEASYSQGAKGGGEKENVDVLGLCTIAWEKVKACCSVGPRERSRWGEREREEEEEEEKE